MLGQLLEGFGIAEADIKKVVTLTGPAGGRAYGATYSDIRQRLVPGSVMQAFANKAPLSGAELVAAAKTFEPTRPFGAP